MKFCKVSLFLALLVAACLPAVAQTALRVEIPFNFIASGKSLPAGHYNVWRSTDFAWCLSDGHNNVYMITSPIDSSEKAHGPSLLFLRAGGTYSLIQIWDRLSGVDVQRSKVKQTLVSKDESKHDEYIEIAAN
jgi:hypothetical protein